MKKSGQEVELHQNSTFALKTGPSKQTDNLPPNTAPNTLHSESTDEAMELNVYGPSLAPRFGDAQSEHHHSDLSELPEQLCSARAKKHSDKCKQKVQAKYIFLSLHPQRRISPLVT